MSETMCGYTAKELLAKAFSKLTPKNWLHGEILFHYKMDGKCCIVGKCAELVGIDPSVNTVMDVETFLSDNDIDVGLLTRVNDRNHSLEDFKEEAKLYGWI